MLIAKTYQSSYGKGEPPNHREFTVVSREKALPRIQNTSQNPKHFPESKTRPKTQNPKTLPRTIKTLLGIQKHFPEFIKTLPRIQNTFGFWDLYLDSGKCFWILGSIFPYEPRSTKKLQSWGWVGLKRLIITMKTWFFSPAVLQKKDRRKFMTFTLHSKCGWCITNG